MTPHDTPPSRDTLSTDSTRPVEVGLTPEHLERAGEVTERVLGEVHQAYVGPRSNTELLWIALLAKGHILLEGVPGVAKTMLCKTFSATLGCTFKRIQFTPDMLPSDITGTYIFSPRDGQFQLREGPIFSNIVLGDEINRAPAKTQSALLEAMQEFQTTIEGESRILPSPFFVLATQNPVEQAGTYPLPEAQLDRFLIRLRMGYPSKQDEHEMVRRLMRPPFETRSMINAVTVVNLQTWVYGVHVEDSIIDYAIRMSLYTRQMSEVRLGASPRASYALVHAARARALCKGRAYVVPDDLKELAPHVLCHRLIMNNEALMDGIEAERVISKMLQTVSVRG